MAKISPLRTWGIDQIGMAFWRVFAEKGRQLNSDPVSLLKTRPESLRDIAHQHGDCHLLGGTDGPNSQSAVRIMKNHPDQINAST